MKSLKICSILVLLLTSILSARAAGRIFFVAPNGVATNNGSQSSPWDLQTALNYRPNIVSAGDTIYLRGGVYKGSFTSFLVGAPGSPIVVRSLPGEWAIIDGNPTLNLAGPIGTGGGSITLSGDVNLPNPSVVMIERERIRLGTRNGNTFSIAARGLDGTAAAPHAAGSPVRPVSEVLTIAGSDVVFGNFEVTDTKVQRILQVGGSNPVDFDHRSGGIYVYAPRSKVINTVVHDTGQGISFWEQAVDSEIYGNILYNNGEQAPDRGHGHGIYSQNSVGRKNIEENITFGNFGSFGMQVYGSSSAQLRGYSISGNINFLNQYLVGGNAPADDIRLDSNFLYGDGFRIGYGNPNNGAVVVTNNYAFGSMPVEIQFWKKVTMTGNRFYHTGSSTGASAVIALPPGQNLLSQYQINNNRYIFGRSFQDKPFYIKTPTVSVYDFSQWQKLGFDVNGTWLGATSTSRALIRPTGVDVFYRPNKYETGRAHVIIYNYDNVPAFNLDLSKTGLPPGARFEIRNGQNFKAPPIFVGTYSSQFVTVNFGSLRIAQPFGNTTVRNPELAANFSVLVIVPLPNGSLPTGTPSVTPVTSPTPPVTSPTPQTEIPQTETPQTEPSKDRVNRRRKTKDNN